MGLRQACEKVVRTEVVWMEVVRTEVVRLEQRGEVALRPPGCGRGASSLCGQCQGGGGRGTVISAPLCPSWA